MPVNAYTSTMRISSFCTPLQASLPQKQVRTLRVSGYVRRCCRCWGHKPSTDNDHNLHANWFASASFHLSNKPHRPDDNDANTFWVGVASQSALGGTGALLCLASNKPLLGAGFSQNPSILAAALVATIPLLLFSFAVGQVDARMRKTTVEYCQQVFMKRSVWEIVLFCLVVALSEEVLFRSFLMQLLVERYGSLEGQIGSSLLFGLAHGTSSSLIFASVVSGIYLAWLFINSGNSVTLPLLVHFLFNFISIIVYKYTIWGDNTE